MNEKKTEIGRIVTVDDIDPVDMEAISTAVNSCSQVDSVAGLSMTISLRMRAVELIDAALEWNRFVETARSVLQVVRNKTAGLAIDVGSEVIDMDGRVVVTFHLRSRDGKEMIYHTKYDDVLPERLSNLIAEDIISKWNSSSHSAGIP